MDLATAAKIYSQLQTALDSPITNLQIEEQAMKMVRWEEFAPFFELSEAEQEEIRRNNERNYRLQKRAALYEWKDKKGRQATLRGFLNEFDRIEKRSSTETDVLGNYRNYLVKCYAVAPHPSHSSWPFSEGDAYVDLPLFEAPLKEEPSSQQGTRPRKLVTLNEVFHACKAKRKIALLEGVAGCGKTTLTWHAYQMWANGKMLEMFPLLIHVSLEDPAIQSATDLADIIPHPSSETREAVAKTIAEQHGKGVCFLLDGWDELPSKAQTRRSFLYKLIEGRPGRIMLSHCSIIVTSRPQAAGTLYPLLKPKSKIVIGRLDRRSINDLFDECLSPDESEQLLKKFEQRPQLANLCNLPINAMIVIYLFRSGIRTLPATRTGLFKALLCNMLIRHTQLRTEHDERELGEEFEFEHLPEDLLTRFTALCCLAFKGIMEQRKVFNMAALKVLGLTFPLDTLSLMEAHLTSVGFMRSFSFLHYSVQEFLAAWHITRLGSEEQAKAVSDILHSIPLSPVLPFFAGLTGLSSLAVRDVLLGVTKHPLDQYSVLNNKPHTASEDRRRLALALLNCIYEAQDPTLCQLVKPPSEYGLGAYGKRDGDISFKSLGLNPGDCLSVGYFLAHQRNFLVDLSHCFINESGMEQLLQQLNSVLASGASSAPVDLNLSYNELTDRSMKLLNTTPRLRKLGVKGSWKPSQVATNLKHLIHNFCRRSSPTQIYIADCNITREHVHLLVLLITACRCIDFLGLSQNDIGGEMKLIGKALELNTTLKGVSLDDCFIRDDSLTMLANSLQIQGSIGFLAIARNPFSPRAFKSFLETRFQPSRPLQLELGRPLTKEEKLVYKQLDNVVIDAVHRTIKKRFNEDLRSVPPDVRRRDFKSQM